jgi:hypothetical protein
MQVQTVEAIVKALNAAEVQYLVVGGLAVVAHGFLRFTNDVDLVIALQESNLLKGLRALEAIGYRAQVPVTPEEFVRPENRERWRREKSMIVLSFWSQQHPATPVDVFLSEPFPFEAEYSRAPQFEVASGVWAPFVSKQTLLEMKQSAARPQDIEDIRRLKLL